MDGRIPVGDVLRRIPGLLTVPYSRFRAKRFEDHPPNGSGASSEPGWLGFGTDTSYAVTIANLLITAVGGKKAKRSLLKFPHTGGGRKQPRTIAEFVVAARGAGLNVQDHG